jgi:hypothetical protein
MWMHNVKEKHYTGCQHSTPFVMYGPMQFLLLFHNTLDIIVVHCCMNSTISVPYSSQTTVVTSYLADVCLNFPPPLV